MEWKTVQIPEPLYKEIQKVHERLGYPSVSALVREAVRVYLRKILGKEVISIPQEVAEEVVQG